MNFNSDETHPFHLNLALKHVGPHKCLAIFAVTMATSWTLVKYITGGTISQFLKTAQINILENIYFDSEYFDSRSV